MATCRPIRRSPSARSAGGSPRSTSSRSCKRPIGPPSPERSVPCSAGRACCQRSRKPAGERDSRSSYPAPPRSRYPAVLKGGTSPTRAPCCGSAPLVTRRAGEAMTRRSFHVRDVVEMLMHWHAGRKMAVVARSLGVDRGTVSKYVAPAKAAGLAPGGPPLSRSQWAALVREWFPELVDLRHRSPTHDAINAHRAQIAEMLRTNTVTTVHQRLRDERGLRVGLTSFRRYVWREFPEDRARQLATPPRPEVPPGEEGQIDYEFLGTWFDPALERLRRVWAFVMVLAHSRNMFRGTFSGLGGIHLTGLG